MSQKISIVYVKSPAYKAFVRRSIEIDNEEKAINYAKAIAKENQGVVVEVVTARLERPTVVAKFTNVPAHINEEFLMGELSDLGRVMT